jgi:hypothetical protein
VNTRLRSRATIALIALSLTGCASGPSVSPSPGAPSNTGDDVISVAIARAAADSRTDASQTDALATAAASGDVAFDTVNEALGRELTCLEEAGFAGGRIVTDDSMGFPSPGIVDLAHPPNISDNQADQLLDDCDAKYATFVLYAYAQQPASQDAYWALADAAAPDIRRCLVASGVPDSAIGSSTAEVVDTAVAFFMELDDELTQYGSENCLGDLPVPTANR